MPEQVAEPVKKQRSARMLALAKESAQGFQKQWIGKTPEVLWEQQANGIWSGLTGNYIKVYAKYAKDLTNQVTLVKLSKLYKDGAWGEI
jgi:threonylcarbamoyladenosine tRNA methylthiotransferase MtaB